MKEITYNGKTQRLSAWAKETGISETTIRYRLRNEWPADQILGNRIKPRRGPEPKETVTYQGETKLLAQWAAEGGLTAGQLRCRLRRGWPIKAALETPVMQRGGWKQREGA